MKNAARPSAENRAMVVQSVKQNANILLEKLEYWV